MKTRKRELAKVGIFGSIENPTIVTEKDLLEIAETFTEQQTAPIQFGHWADAASPRLGNVVAVEYDPVTQTLSGTIEENETLSKAVDDGYFPDCSIGAKKRASDGKMYLHHLAYLGEEPPAIKDLKNNLQNQLSQANGNEELAASDKTNCICLPSVKQKQLMLADSKPKKENQMTNEEITALQEENARLKAENEANAKLLSDQNKKCFEAEKEKLKDAVKGKLSEEDTSMLLNLCDAFENNKVIELSDCNGSKKALSPLAELAKIFSHINLPVNPGELNLSDFGSAQNQKTANYASMMKAM